VALITLYLLGEYLTGGFARVVAGTQGSLGIRATATLFLLTAYVPIAHLFLRRGTARRLTDLRAVFGDAVSLESSATPGSVSGVVGALAFLLLFMLAPMLLESDLQVSYSIVAASVGGVLFGWFAGRFAVCMVKDSLRMSAQARVLPQVDLLDLSPLSPFVKQGLQSALLTVLIPGLSLHLAVAPGDRMIASWIYLVIWLALTLTAFALPVQGIHGRIRREKERALAQIRARIRDAQAALLCVPESDAGSRLPALLALEERIERVPEWPTDASSWRRLGLYLLLGLGSWVGAAVVERMLDWSL
jgi:hypothetical protein